MGIGARPHVCRGLKCSLFSNKNKAMDNIQKHNNRINRPLSQTSRPYLQNNKLFTEFLFSCLLIH
jgi:hypothetical protein